MRKNRVSGRQVMEHLKESRVVEKAAILELADVLNRHGLVIWGSEYFGVSKPEDAYYDGPVSSLAGCIDADNLNVIASEVNKNDTIS